MAATPAAVASAADAKRQPTHAAAAGGGDTKTASAVGGAVSAVGGAVSGGGGAADAAKAAVFVVSEEMPQGVPVVKGYDFNSGLDYKALFQAFATTGFQATHMAQAVAQVNAMLRWRLSDEPLTDDDRQLKAGCSAAEWAEEEARRRDVKCTVFLGYTSNMISCGQREVIRYLCEHKLVDAIVTTAGGVEEDFIKCLAPFYLGDFKLSGKSLRAKGLNRIGNLLVPNKNYRLFEDWFTPIYAEMLAEQNSGPADKRVSWTPSKVIARLGERIGNRESVYYWCWKNSIPVFCPALTDGSIGDMIFFQSFQATDANPALRIDIVEDLRRINGIAMDATRTGAVILGGGIVKHHICNANLMRNGADYAVYINTAHEWDGSDAGASPDEAISWGKIKLNAEPVKLCGEAALLFPLLVAQTFAEVVEQRKAAAAAAAKATPAAAAAATAPAAPAGAKAAAVASNSAPK